MNEDVLIDLFYVGFNNRTAPSTVSQVSSTENHLIVLGRKFALNHKTPPQFIFMDGDGVLNVSEDMVTCYGVFSIGREIKLIDQYGQFIEISNYPSDEEEFEYKKTRVPNLALVVNVGQ